ncbi:MAG TPA: Stk1 family PASTA domain-containing Ser/Thr kinase [Acidimicrobiales bacterium]|nr:Stk1 family PASTA domain-containing Ser/Thr kinase [Acidimicrobiales bacterium]
MSQPSSQQVFSGRYEITRHLARGGMAEVYLARDLLLDRPVALKVLFPELSTDRNFVERFRREAQAAANLSHPNIVSIYDWCEEDGTYFIVMEYVEGRTLGQIVRGDGPLLSERAAEIGADVAAALGFAHRSDVVHRDVKPGNVLISPTGQVKVTDFGIARAANSDQDLTQTGAVMGTATYFSPEQAQGNRVDGRSDVYSLGVVLYELCVGKPPFAGENPMVIAYKHVREEPVPPRAVNADVPEAFEAIVLQAMAKNPNDRYSSADELRQDLLRFVQGRMVLANPTVAVAAVDSTVAAPAFDATQAMNRTQVADRTVAVGAAGRGGPPQKRGTGAFVVLLLVLLALLAGLLWFVANETGLIGDDSAERVEMPSVLGKTQAEAEAELDALELDVQVVTEASDQQEPGRVFAQDPVAGGQVDQGAAVTIKVVAEAVKVKVPEFVGKDVDDAEDLAAAAGLNLTKTEEPSATVEADKVISQGSPAGTEVAQGSAVAIVVSTGKGQKVVPDVGGDEAAEAANELGQAGFKTRTVREPSSTVDEGRVIRTDPPAGQRLDEGSVVTMVVSTGPELTAVPNVLGMTPEEARAAIEGSGFVFRNAGTANSNPSDDGRAVAQNPSGGSRAEKGATVAVTFGKASILPTTTTAPSTTTTND